MLILVGLFWIVLSLVMMVVFCLVRVLVSGVKCVFSLVFLFWVVRVWV